MEILSPGNFNLNGRLGWIVWGGLMVDYLIRLVGSICSCNTRL